MEHNNINKDLDGLERLFRSELDETAQTPDAELWANIAAKQKKANLWLKAKYYAPSAAGLAALLLVAFIGWKQLDSPSVETAQLNAEQIEDQFLTAVHQMATESKLPVAPGPELSDADKKAIADAPHKFVNIPPYRLRQNTVPGNVLRFDSQSGMTYENPQTGTQVHIPGGVLIHQDGTPVMGEVEFNIWEYRSLADYAASGIPMHYADERGEFAFNSGGMFEMRVRQNAEELLLAPGKSMGMNFKPTHQQTQPSLFYLDEAQQKWLYQPNPTFVAAGETTSALPPVVDEDVAIRDNVANRKANFIGSNRKGKYTVVECGPIVGLMPKDARGTDWIMDGVRVGQELAYKKRTLPAWFKKNSWMTDSIMLTALEMNGLVHFVHHKDQTELFFPEDENNLFSELSAFKNAYFTIINDGQAKPGLDDYFEYIRITKEVGNVCTIKAISSKKGLTKIHAMLVASPGNMNFDSDKVFDEYDRLRKERVKVAQKQIQDLRCFLTCAPMFQTEKEWCMDPQAWMTYFEDVMPEMRKRYNELVNKGYASNSTLVKNAWINFQSRLMDMSIIAKNDLNNGVGRGANAMDYALRLTNFGAFNCDQIMSLARRFSPGETLKYVQKPTFMLASGELVHVKSLTCIEHETRLFFTMPSTNVIPDFRKRNFSFLITDSKGRNYHMPADRFQSGAINKLFVLDKVGEDVRTVGDWSRLLQLIG